METSKGWTLVMSIAEQYRDTNRIFRGEPEVGRELLPKVGRAGAGTKGAYKPKHERMMLDRFKDRSIPYLSNSFSPRSEIEWLALAQHHGMPTRLLDWTESVIVAAYFAVQHMGAKGAGILYSLNLPDFVEKDHQNAPLTISKGRRPVRYRPPHLSERISIQKSVFTLHPNPIREWPWGKELERFEITPDDCGRMKKTLDNLGINEASLFPGLDGLASHLGWLYKWGR